MLRFDLPQHDTRYAVWLELQTRDELSPGMRDHVWSLGDEMAQRSAVSLNSPYNQHITTHTIPYTDLLAAFPDIDADTLYVIPHYEFYGARVMQKYIVNKQVEPILDTVMTVTEWIELYPLEQPDAASADLNEMSAMESGNTSETMIRVPRALTDDHLSVPFSRVMEEFPGLDPAQTFVVTSYGIEFEGTVGQAEVDAEFAKRGWRLTQVSDVSAAELEAHKECIRAGYPKSENDDTPSPFVYEDRGYRLKLSR
jgi:hypothetical protein